MVILTGLTEWPLDTNEAQSHEQSMLAAFHEAFEAEQAAVGRLAAQSTARVQAWHLSISQLSEGGSIGS